MNDTFGSIVPRCKLSRRHTLGSLRLSAEKQIDYRILLAEDDPGVMYTFKAVLEQEGFSVDCAGTFEGAKAALRDVTYDAIITDFALDREDLGLELAREAKRRSPAPAILIYTSHPTVERLRHALAARVDYFAFKPIDLDEIKLAITRLVTRRAEGLMA